VTDRRSNERPSAAARLARWFPAAILLSSLGLAAHAAPQTPIAGTAPSPAEHPWRIVILNGTDPYLPAFVEIDRSMRATLTAPGTHPAEIYSETLDMMRFPGAELEPEVLALLRRKYANRDIDAVIAVTPAALDFAERHHDSLWPRAYIVFHSVSEEVLRGRKLRPMTTGVPFRYDAAGTVELALRLWPSAERVIVIGGSSDFDRYVTAIAREQLQALGKRVPVEFWTELTFEELLDRVSRLSKRAVVLHLAINRDANGRMFVPRDAMARLAGISPAPVFSLFETFVGRGIVAGKVDDYEVRGRRAAQLVQAALSGPAAAAPPRPEVLPSVCVADARELRRWDISASSLPAGCTVRFAEPSAWQRYRWQIITALAIIASQSVLIAALVLQRRGRRRAEDEARHRRAELAQASRLALAGELTASIAHEINQPLGAILANAGAAESLLRRGVTDSAKLRAIVADIKQDDLRASEIIRRVRALVTTRRVEREVVDVNAIVRDVLAFLSGDSERRGVAIDAAPTPELPPVLADRVQLQQALVNLCVNALDAMAQTAPEKRCLSVRTSSGAGPSVEIAVGDTGGGIPPNQLPHLFDSFFSTKPDGMGLGLSISRSIVEEHGGTLSAENRADGALFRIVLPAYFEGAPAPGPRASLDAASAQRAFPAASLSKGSS